MKNIEHIVPIGDSNFHKEGSEQNLKTGEIICKCSCNPTIVNTTGNYCIVRHNKFSAIQLLKLIDERRELLKETCNSEDGIYLGLIIFNQNKA